MGIIIAAGALFTAVYDVLYRYNSSNTTNLNAATVDKTGQTNWSLMGTTKTENGETAAFNFDQGTYMVIFGGQNGYTNRMDIGHGAVCIAFYKADGGVNYGPNNMTVQIGLDFLAGQNADCDGGGKTLVTTNFALPDVYKGSLRAVASGGGGGTYWGGRVGSFGSWNEGTDWASTGGYRCSDSYNESWSGSNGSWTNDGFRYDEVRTRQGKGPGGEGNGGAGYYNGGGGYGEYYGGASGGSGSCTPWCYPLYCEEIYSRLVNGSQSGSLCEYGGVWFYRIDPVEASYPDGKTVGYDDGVAELVVGLTPDKDGSDRKIPVQGVKSSNSWWANFDCGIRVGWVYSVSEDGKSWHGVGPDKIDCVNFVVMNEKVKNEE